MTQNAQMKNALRFAVMATVGLTTGVWAQDPTTSLPDAYKLELENDYVRVVRVHYDAGAKLPEHTHAAGTTVYVYLNDSDGVVFKHSGNNNRSVTRPAVKAGAIRISTGGEEHHTAENNSETPSDFLRIWLKTDNAGARNMRRVPPGELEYSNKQIRITRIKVEPGQKTLIEAKHEPALRIMAQQGMTYWKTLPANLVKWLDKGTTEEFTNVGDGPRDLIRIDFLTGPK